MEFLYTFHSSIFPTVKDVSDLENIPLEFISSKFGVVEIDPKEQLYAVLVNEQWLKHLDVNNDFNKKIYSNTRVITFEEE